MKRILLVLTVLMFLFAQANGAQVKNKRYRVKPPKECRTTKYTCILKKNDGIPFFCVRTSRQRHQNARKKVRIVSKRNCIRRYPVEYIKDNEPEKKD